MVAPAQWQGGATRKGGPDMTTLTPTDAPSDAADDDDTVCIDVPPDPSALPRARACLLDTARRWGIEEADDLRIVASELITNAVVHGHSGPRVCLRLHRGGVTIEVADDDPGEPTPGRSTAEGSLGLGLEIVDTLAADWGVRRTGARKVVWARFEAA